MLKMNALCAPCFIGKHAKEAYKLDPVKATDFCKELLPLVADAIGTDNSCHLDALTRQLYKKHFGYEGDPYAEEKRLSNEFVLERLPRIRELVMEQKDPVFAALQFAILGNYLDFSALKGNVSFEKLDEMLINALSMELPEETYASLRADLQAAKTLLYVTDNAGEIGFDRIFAEVLQQAYPDLQITFCVRGAPTLNDATREDAAVMGIPFPIIDTGNDICGVELDLLGDEARHAMDTSDVIFTKGMGNVETLYGSKYNIYFAFLTKCDLIMEVFQKPFLTPMLVHQGS